VSTPVPNAPNTPTPEPAENAAEAVPDFAAEAENLCAALDKTFRRLAGEMPKSADVAEIRALQASIREVVEKAASTGQGSIELELEQLKQNAALSTEVAKLKEAATRARADFLNYQERARKDLERAEESALRGYLAELLPILDNLDLAMADLKSEKSNPAMVGEALSMTSQSFDQVLKVRGLERVEALHQPFDPLKHEAVATRPVDPSKDEKTNQVVEVFRSGYLWKGKVLRPAQVLVTK